MIRDQKEFMKTMTDKTETAGGLSPQIRIDGERPISIKP